MGWKKISLMTEIEEENQFGDKNKKDWKIQDVNDMI